MMHHAFQSDGRLCCLRGDVVQPGSSAHRKEWGSICNPNYNSHEAMCHPREMQLIIELTQNKMYWISSTNWNILIPVQPTCTKIFCFGFSSGKLKSFGKNFNFAETTFSVQKKKIILTWNSEPAQYTVCLWSAYNNVTLNSTGLL